MPKGDCWWARRSGRAATSSKGLLSPPDPLMFLPLPAFLIVTLYWVRWWAIRPPRLYVEALQEQETLPG